MSKTGNGLPVYLPKPVKPYGDVRVGVVPGDVGTYNPSKGFKRITNLWVAEQNGALPVGLPAREVSVDEQVIPEGHVLSEGASSRKLCSRSQKRYAHLHLLFISYKLLTLHGLRQHGFIIRVYLRFTMGGCLHGNFLSKT